MTADRAGLPRYGSALLLAGGKSRRMGVDKQTLSLNNTPLTESLLAFLRRRFDTIIVSTDKPERYRAAGLSTAADRFPGLGPLAGLEAGLRLARSEYVYVIGCDMPFGSDAYLDALTAALDAATAAGERPDGVATRLDGDRIEPLNAFYRHDLADAMAAALADGRPSLNRFCRGRAFVYLSDAEARAVSPDLHVFDNLNRPPDLAGLVAAGADAPPRHVLEVPIIRLTAETANVQTDRVIREAELALTLQPGGETFRFAVLAERLDDFACGWLLSTGRIRTADDVVTCTAAETAEDVWSMTVELNEPGRRSAAKTGTPERLPLSAEQLLALFAELNRASALFHETGATHDLAFCDKQGQIIDIVQEISRHAALDKLIGRALRDGRDFSGLILLTSCRLTASIVAKAAAAGIPVIASRAAVTSQAIRLAAAHQIRLLGFVRNGRLNLYT